jgi:hypothetical protein
MFSDHLLALYSGLGSACCPLQFVFALYLVVVEFDGIHFFVIFGFVVSGFTWAYLLL